MPPETTAADFSSILERAVARLRARHLIRAAEAGLAGAAIAILPTIDLVRTHPLRTALIAAAAGIACAAACFAWLARKRTRAAAARAFEASDPSLHNLVVTAHELLARPDRTPSYMRDRVLADAARRAGSLDPARVVPLGRAIAASAAAAVLLAALLGLGVMRVPGSGAETPAARSRIPTSAPLVDGFTVELSPPSYTGRTAVRLINPVSIDAWAGTEALIRVPSGATSLVRLNGTALTVGADGVARTVLSESGYVAIEAGAVHRLLPLSVTPDRAPDVRIVAPGKDLRIATTAVSIPIAAEAADDLALRTFELRYTVVSGTGEQFSFTEGTLPATLVRGSDRAWRIESSLSPARLKLEPGDALIYRAVAADRRPGEAGAASSDTFFVEIAGPGDVALAGVEMPPDKERYALSEAMIVLKIERLQAREPGMARPALEEAAGGIAAEQRAVRANFIFLLGGEIQDEEVEAETSSEIAEGRFANRARQEIVAATVLMGRVERALTAVSTKEALPPARDAVRALQRAFGHSRYLLRALPSRARIDPARRLTGDLASAADWSRSLAPPAADADTEAARSALVDVIDTARALDAGAERAAVAARVSRIAERVLAVSARAPDLQPSARDLVAARDAAAAGQFGSARSALQRAAGPLVARAQRGRTDAAALGREVARLAGAAAIGGGR